MEFHLSEIECYLSGIEEFHLNEIGEVDDNSACRMLLEEYICITISQQ